LTASAKTNRNAFGRKQKLRHVVADALTRRRELLFWALFPKRFFQSSR
jgi:hypothetical protein